MSGSVRRMFGDRIADRIKNLHIFVVGVGGIGSELLKNLITLGCQNIDILDIDTIDITNLNRQFLFKREDVKKHKSTVARERALKHKKDLNINAFTFDVCTMKASDIRKYDIIINALDNQKARRYVNKLCVLEKKVLIEAGSTGFSGQVYPIFYNETKCYNCEEKPKPKTFAICTIRHTPSLPEHCVAWGKLLFEMFFSKSDNETLIEIKEHIEEETKKKQGIDEEQICQLIFDHLFYESINELNRLKKDFVNSPKPIKFEKALEENSTENGENEKREEEEEVNEKKIKLKSQEIWNERKCKEIYQKTFHKLYPYLNINKTNEKYLMFDKDDDDCMDFITAVSNLRMYNYSIPPKSKFEIQSIAGSIIPAIASTNAMVASLQAVQLIHIIEYLEKQKEKKENTDANTKEPTCVTTTIRDSKASHVWVNSIVSGSTIFTRGNLIQREPLEPPNPNCYVCQQPIINVYIKNFNEITLFDFVKDVCTNELSCLHPLVDTETRNIFDYEIFLEGNTAYIKKLYTSLNSWGIKNEDVLLLTDILNSDGQMELHLKKDDSLETPYLIKERGAKTVKKRKREEIDKTNLGETSTKRKATEKNRNTTDNKDMEAEKRKEKKHSINNASVVCIDDTEVSKEEKCIMID